MAKDSGGVGKNWKVSEFTHDVRSEGFNGGETKKNSSEKVLSGRQ